MKRFRRIRIFTITTILVSMLLSSTAFAATTDPATLLKTATQYVTIAEQYKSGVGTVQAANAIALLPNGNDKNSLSARLNAVNEYIYQQKVIAATNAVANAEKLNNVAVANNSLVYVAQLKEGDEKDALIQRVYNITTTVDTATKQVSYAEIAKDKISVKRAQMYVNGLKEKDKKVKKDLQDKLDKIKVK